MGALYGGRLAAADVEVTLVDVWEAHVDAMNADGLTIERPATEQPPLEVDVAATTNPATVGPVDLVIVFVKSTQTGTAVSDAGELVEDAEVLTLQNGLGNPEAIAEYVPRDRILAGVTTFGSELVGPGRVRMTVVGDTRFGRYFRENDEVVDDVAEVFRAAGFETETVAAPQNAIWEKVLLNIAVNPVAALADVRTKAITGTEPGRRLMDALLAEGIRVAEADGAELPEGIAAEIRSMVAGAGDSKPSMAQDVAAGRQTEIETLNGEVARRAETHDLDATVNQTVADLVRMIDTTRD